MEEFRYEAASKAALAVLHTLASNPAMPRHEKLSRATYLILDAIGQVEERLSAGDGLPACPGCQQRYHEVEVLLQGNAFRCRVCGCGSQATAVAGRR